MFTFEQARAEDWQPALELACGPLPTAERRRRVGNLLAMLAIGELDPGGLWLARRRGQLVGVQVCVPLPGASALFWPPRVALEGEGAALAEQLVRVGLNWAANRGARVGQALLVPHAPALGKPLLAAGFRPVTELQALRHPLDELTATTAQTPLRLEAYPSADRDLFERTLVRTYEGTLDCPELNGVRSVAEVLDGHRGAGRERPELWALVWMGERPAGVLLLTELMGSFDWELSYLGVVPELRGRGLGRALVLRALREARRGGAAGLLLSVDARNEPARRLYQRVGFAPVESRLVYLYFFPRPAVDTETVGSPGYSDGECRSAPE